MLVKSGLANVNSPIPGFSTKIVPDLRSIFDSPKLALSGDPRYLKFTKGCHTGFSILGPIFIDHLYLGGKSKCTMEKFLLLFRSHCF